MKAQRRTKTVVRGRAEERKRGKCNKDGVTTYTRRTTVLPRILSPPKRLLNWMRLCSASIVHLTSSTSRNSSPLRFIILYTVWATVATFAGTQNGVFNTWLSQRRETALMSCSHLQIGHLHHWQLFCCFWFVLLEPSGHYTYHHFNIHKFYFVPIQCIYVFCVDLRTNSDYFTVQHWLVGFYNWDGVCLLRGTFYILRSAHTAYLCVLCGSENKQRLFHCTALTGWFL